MGSYAGSRLLRHLPDLRLAVRNGLRYALCATLNLHVTVCATHLIVLPLLLSRRSVRPKLGIYPTWSWVPKMKELKPSEGIFGFLTS